ncbi:MAG: AraC family transcriptional regulator [Planctomycetota bacterium]|jgi:AraC-like DNA-binding protein|nr:AraC family transcriptional regulator [Planctomycetota bacterium]
MRVQELTLGASRTLLLHRLQENRSWTGRIRLRLTAAHAGRWGPNYKQRERVALDHELECLLAGRTSYTFAGRDTDIILNPGEALLKPPGIACAAHPLSSPVQRICFHFDWDHTSAVPSGSMPFAFPHLGPVNRSAIRPTPSWVPLTLPLQRPFPSAAWRKALLAVPPMFDHIDKDICLARLEAAVTALLLEWLDDTQRGDSLVEQIREYLDAEFAQDVSIAGLARDHHMSASQLSRRFKSAFGISPSTYLQEVRLREALRLLAEGCAVSVVAPMVGFDDPKYFARVFARRMGMPPSAARNHLSALGMT